MIRQNWLLRVSMTALVITALSGCGSSSGTSTGDTDTDTGTTTTFEDGGDAGNSAAAASASTTVGTSAGASANTASNEGVQSLVRAQLASRYVAASQPQNETISYDLGTITEDCPDGGQLTLTGSISGSYDTSSYSFDVSGDMGVGLDACEATATVTASDGTCDFTVIIDGDIALVYDLSGTASDYDVSIAFATTSPLSVSVNDTTITMDMDMSYSMNSSDSEVTYEGTVTVDGNEVDVSEEINTEDFTMEELGCEAS